MAIERYKTGVSSIGMDEWTSEYACDWPNCKRAADYDGLCEEHFHESGAAEEHRQEAARLREEEELARNDLDV